MTSCTIYIKVTKILLFRLFAMVKKFSRGYLENTSLMIAFSLIPLPLALCLTVWINITICLITWYECEWSCAGFHSGVALRISFHGYVRSAADSLGFLCTMAIKQSESEADCGLHACIVCRITTGVFNICYYCYYYYFNIKHSS